MIVLYFFGLSGLGGPFLKTKNHYSLADLWPSQFPSGLVNSQDQEEPSQASMWNMSF